MAEKQTVDTKANGSAEEAPPGHDFRQMNQLSKDLLCLKDGIPDLEHIKQFNFRFYGLNYDGAQKACPCESKLSAATSLCRTTEPNTHCPYLSKNLDAEFAFKSGRCQVSENTKTHPDGKIHSRDLLSEGGRQHAILCHLKGRQQGHETPFVSAHDSLNRSIGRGMKCKASDLTIISTRKLVQLGYPIIQSKVAMVEYSIGYDKDWLFSTEWLLLWRVPHAAIVKSYAWRHIQTKEGTLAGSKFRKQVAREVYDFEVQHGITPALAADEDPLSSDEEAKFVHKRSGGRAKKVKKATNNSEKTPSAQGNSVHIKKFTEQHKALGNDIILYDGPVPKVGDKRKRMSQHEVEGYEPHESVRLLDMASFAESARTQGYARTFLQATVSCRAAYPIAKLPGFPSETFLKRRDHGNAKDRRGLSIKDLMSLRIAPKTKEDRQDDDDDAQQDDVDEDEPKTQLVTLDQSDDLAHLASRLSVDFDWLQN